MPYFAFVYNNFWFLAILVTVFTALQMRRGLRASAPLDPALRARLEQFLRGYTAWQAVPWLVMGLGRTVGRVPSFSDFFTPRSGNPFVIAWHLSLIGAAAVLVRWIYLRGGAEFLASNSLVNREMSALKIRLLLGLMLLGSIAAMIAMWSLEPGSIPRI